jgi:hypothetical protein
MPRQNVRRWEVAAAVLLPLAALFYFGFRVNATLNRALPDVLLGDRADIETAMLLYLPEVAMEPAFDELLQVARYPHPLIGPRRTDWNGRLTEQVAAVQRAQGLDPDLLSGGPRPLDDLYDLKTASLDQFGKAIDIALIGGIQGPRGGSYCGPAVGAEPCLVRELFARAYGDQAAREAL